MNIGSLDTSLYLFSLSTARLAAAFVLMPYLSKSTLGSAMIRNGVVASLCLFLYPIVAQGYKEQTLLSWLTLAILCKEILLGLLLGFIINIPFWAVEGVGFFIDNQRGAAMAGSLNPGSGSEASPLGLVFFQALITLFFISGSFLVLLGVLYKSYDIWPVFEFLPELGANWIAFFLDQVDFLMRLIVLVAAPIIIGMFLAELGLALISRFAPQLNVFVLAMPIKSAVAIAILVIYASVIIQYFSEQLLQTPNLLRDMTDLLPPADGQ